MAKDSIIETDLDETPAYEVVIEEPLDCDTAEKYYKQAVSQERMGDYKGASELFSKIQGFRDADTHFEQCDAVLISQNRYETAAHFIGKFHETGDGSFLKQAVDLFELSGWDDSADQAEKCRLLLDRTKGQGKTPRTKSPKLMQEHNQTPLTSEQRSSQTVLQPEASINGYTASTDAAQKNTVAIRETTVAQQPSGVGLKTPVFALFLGFCAALWAALSAAFLVIGIVSSDESVLAFSWLFAVVGIVVQIVFYIVFLIKKASIYTTVNNVARPVLVSVAAAFGLVAVLATLILFGDFTDATKFSAFFTCALHWMIVGILLKLLKLQS